MNLRFFDKIQEDLFRIGDTVRLIHQERIGDHNTTFIKLGKIEAISEVGVYFIKIRTYANASHCLEENETTVAYTKNELVDMLKNGMIEKI